MEHSVLALSLCSSQPILRASFAKNMKELYSHNIPLTSVKQSCKNVQGGVLGLRGWSSNPTYTTYWLGGLEQVA